MEPPLASQAKASPGPLAAPVPPVMTGFGGTCAAQDLCPWSFYQRHGWAWTPQGWGGPCAIFGDSFLEAAGRLGNEILSHVQYLCSFSDVYLPKHLFMQ